MTRGKIKKSETADGSPDIEVFHPQKNRKNMSVKDDSTDSVGVFIHDA